MNNRNIQYWVIPPESDAEFVACMEDVLETYAKPYNQAVPVLCMDEQPVQLVRDVKVPIAATKDHPKRVDYTYGNDEISQTVREYDTDGNITSEETHIFGHDGHDSVRVLYDLAGAIEQVFTFAAYGSMLAVHNGAGTLVGTSETDALTSLGYSGEQFDAATQQQYLRARYYDPTNGRFNRLDPFAGVNKDPQSLHKYAYVHGDPVNNIDPTGKFSVATVSAASTIATTIDVGTIVEGALILETLTTIGGVGAQLRRIATKLLSVGNVEEGLILWDAGNRILGAALFLADSVSTAVGVAQLGTLVTNGLIRLAGKAPKIAKATRGFLRNLTKTSNRKILYSIIRNPIPQFRKAVEHIRKVPISYETYIQGLLNLEDFATANGWRFITESPGTVVNHKGKSAFTDINESEKTIRIVLTSDTAPTTELTEFADEVSHAVNAIRGVEDNNSFLLHARNFDDAASSSLVPYTDAERAILGEFRDALSKFQKEADEFLGF